MRYSFQKSSCTRSAFALILTFILAMACAVTARANPAESRPEATDPNYVSAHKYVSPTEIEGVYRVTLSLDVTVEEIYPPSVITFILDGTSSMEMPIDTSGPIGLDNNNDLKDSRDVAVREAMREALRILMDPR